MKYCTKCGTEIAEDTVICPKCGSTVETDPVVEKKTYFSGLEIAIVILMVLGSIVNAFMMFFIPLIWSIPMIIYYCVSIKKGKKLGVAFKVCSLLFVSLIGGILMFSDNKN